MATGIELVLKPRVVAGTSRRRRASSRWGCCATFCADRAGRPVASSMHGTPEEAVNALSGVTNVRALPAGGRAAVFRVTHSLHGECVMKVYTLEGEPRVAAEVEFLEGIHHEGIMPILDHGQSRWRARVSFTLMPFVEGGSLQDRIDSGACLLTRGREDEVSSAESLMSFQCCGARKVHRDIKPQNVLLPIEGIPILIDFGIVRHLDMSTMTVPAGAPGLGSTSRPNSLLGSGILRTNRMSSL